MSFCVKKGDLFEEEVECIVIPGQPSLVLEGNVGTQAKEHCGERLEYELSQLKPIAIGKAVIVNAYNLRAKKIIYVANPRHFKGGNVEEEEKYLAKSYTSALELAAKFKLSSVAFPLLSAGAYDFSKRAAIDIAIGAIQEFLKKHSDISVMLVIGTEDTWKSYGAMFNMPGIVKITGKIPARSKEFIEAANREHRGFGWYTKEITKNLDNKSSVKRFKDKLACYIAESTVKTVPEICSGIMSATTYSKMLNGHSNLSKDRIIAIGVNMRLSPYDIEDLLSTIGERFDDKSGRDILIREDIRARGTVDSINDHLLCVGFLPLNTR